jgi:NAD(P)-dependent dehydrogenase (short-subunit alcohol dehydrogenase family)
MSLAGRRIVLIGGSSGIGLATAKAAVSQGASVVIAGRSAERLESARSEIGARVETHSLDATQEASVEAFFMAVGAHDHMAVLVPTVPDAEARKSVRGFADTPQGTMEIVMRHKFWCQVFCARHARRHLREGGSIVFITGQAHRKSLPNYPLVAAADAAVEALARELAREYAPLRVNVVAPGLIETPLIRDLPTGHRDALEALVGPQPVPRMGTVEEIAGAILWIMANGFATGTVLEVDGGYKLT